METFLPVLHWFIKTPAASNTRKGTRCSIYYLNQFYDNVYVRVRGGSTAGQENPSHKFDLNPSDWFLYDPNEERVEEFNVNSGVSDKSYLRNILANELYKQTGSPYNMAFPIRVDQNGEFYSLDTFIEQTDKRFLRRHHINEEGVLYKAVGNGGGLQADRLDPPDVEKKTHQEELSHQDLKDMVDQFWALGAAGETYMFDHFNMATLINYMVVNCLINNTDHGHKNIYLYYDREDTQEWMILPWDHDLTLGRTQNPTVFSDGISTNSSATGPWNRIISSVYDSGRNHPQANQMFWRRLQTLTDQYFIDNTFYTGEIERLRTLMYPDVALNYNKWYNPWSWGEDQSFDYALNLITDNFMPGRASYLDGLSITPPTQVLHPGDVSISEVMSNPISGNQNEEYVKISNNTNSAVDLSQWTLSNEHFHYVFPGGSVIPSNNSLFVVPDKPAFRNRTTSPKAGEKRFVIGHHHQYIDNAGGLFSLKEPNGVEWATASYSGVMTELRKSLRIKEIMYNPQENDELYEYLLFENIGTTTIDLGNTALSTGIQFTFTAPTLLEPGEQIILVPFSPDDQESKFQFWTHYPTLKRTIAMAGPFEGRLDNEGEQIQLIDQNFDPIQDFAYQTIPPWPMTPNGGGSALVVIDPTGDYSDPTNWQKSSTEQSYLTWVNERFTPSETEDPLITGMQADPDKDGFPNLLEYAMALKPKIYDTGGIPNISLTVNNGTIISLRYPRNAKAAELSMTLEQSNELSTWNAVGAAWQRVESADAVTYTSPAMADTSSFYLRIVVR
ncbi:MAG: CotH kinase family protein [Verrucomicrobiota bacterium]|nr:CotH kinase family protein [Verrucomicrobiota bacterium]